MGQKTGHGAHTSHREILGGGLVRKEADGEAAGRPLHGVLPPSLPHTHTHTFNWARFSCVLLPPARRPLHGLLPPPPHAHAHLDWGVLLGRASTACSPFLPRPSAPSPTRTRQHVHPPPPKAPALCPPLSTSLEQFTACPSPRPFCPPLTSSPLTACPSPRPAVHRLHQLTALTSSPPGAPG